MGVPAFFAWLSKRYPDIVRICKEQKVELVNGVAMPVDSTQPNPHGMEFDNLYLDMNCIIHPCCHPENKAAPKNEEEMMLAIFEYMDRVFAVVRPRRLVYLAVDGVAPRAKMNQQRARRFRAAQESRERREKIDQRIRELQESGKLGSLPQKMSFDSNCITPGTEFMQRLSDCLRWYVADRISNNPAWKNLLVIFSDASVPGEGEHKIMDYIRAQRARADYKTNMKHVLYGADADLIMLGLATHEPEVYILREQFRFPSKKPCEICGYRGHVAEVCPGTMIEVDEEMQGFRERDQLPPTLIFVDLPLLREHLSKELIATTAKAKSRFQDLTRLIDDWIFMCFFVGNDFLPHLPSLAIQDGAIEKLLHIYKKNLAQLGGYVTENGRVHLSRVQTLLTELGKLEENMFLARIDAKKKWADKQKKRQRDMHKLTGAQMVELTQSSAALEDVAFPNATARERTTGAETPESTTPAPDDDTEKLLDGSEDIIRFGETGWKERYYFAKFSKEHQDRVFLRQMTFEYVKGLCWVLEYYYRGCPDWSMFYPFHYAPFASDFSRISQFNVEFNRESKPCAPLEQILMCHKESPLAEYYPADFSTDLNGKRHAWQGVTLLPFVDEKLINEAVYEASDTFVTEELSRNQRGYDLLYVHAGHALAPQLTTLYRMEDGAPLQPIEQVGEGHDHKHLFGNIATPDPKLVCTPGTVLSILSLQVASAAVCVRYENPAYEKSAAAPVELENDEDALEPQLAIEHFTAPADVDADADADAVDGCDAVDDGDEPTTVHAGDNLPEEAQSDASVDGLEGAAPDTEVSFDREALYAREDHQKTMMARLKRKLVVLKQRRKKLRRAIDAE